jgi:hypothetical protein
MGAALGAGRSPASKKQRARAPDVFDGKEPEKLRTFLFQGVLNFNDRPEDFRADREKVNFMISYLSDDALKWFEPAFINPDPTNLPLWLSNYNLFVAELQTNFGVLDPQADAERKLTSLRMTDGQRISEYLVQFNTLAQETGWNPAALKHQFYEGLPTRIQIKLRDLPGGRPTQYDNLKLSSQSIDNAHWSWLDEKKAKDQAARAILGNQPRSTGNTASAPSGGRSASASTSTTGNKSTGDSRKGGSGGNGGNSGGSPAQAPASDKPWKKFLGSDGKLLPAERARRLAEGLCLLCGLSGHRADDCPKRRPARGTTTVPAADSAAETPAVRQGN